jgi:NAD(P)-dependent dehydrogenase (short-subunit alcohol dehydrogenase family)
MPMTIRERCDAAGRRRLAGRVALVTGAAGGIGAAAARRFAAEGALVAVTDVLDDEGAKVAAELGERGLYTPLDVRDPAAWDNAILAARERFGGAPTILVHNAGVMIRGTAEHADAAAMRHAFEVNVLGPALGTAACVPGMPRSPAAAASCPTRAARRPTRPTRAAPPASSARSASG